MPKKVFELANEMGIGAIDLVEKLKGLGLNVRNHMVTLQDADVSMAMEALSPAKKVKKKVTKKKVVKKVIKKKVELAPKNESSTKEEAAVEESEVAAPVETISKTKILRKKKDIKKDIKKETETSGLGIEAKKESESDGDIFREKMHTFTPVSMPEKPNVSESKEAKPAQSKAQPAAKGTEPQTKVYTSPDANAEKGTAKKRIGDLAAMVTKKGVVGKEKDLTQLRADEQLKLASTVMGRTIYTPIKRKRIYSGSDRKKTSLTQVKDSKRVVLIFSSVKGAELSQKLSQKFEALKNKCLELNLLIKPEDDIGLALAEKISALYNYRVENRSFDEVALLESGESKDNEALPLRNPIITVMGHVDHGKTTLLDCIRKSKVTTGEAGGITQHIGAYSVEVDKSTLTFLDTPGHAAFASMRQRGANVTDIVVLVVAADDGVMPQTKESIKYAKNAGCPLIVAVNKMDKEGANPERIKQELTEFELVSEQWGGDTMFVEISALNGDGIDGLLEAIKLQAEVMDLRASDKGKAEGVVIESRIETGRGPIATVLIQKGTLKKGESIVCGESYGRARTLISTSGENINSAGPSIPVLVLGLNEPPNPGDSFLIAKSEREAKKIIENRVSERKKFESVDVPKVASLEDFFATSMSETGEKKMLNLIIRSDVKGSFEAIKEALAVIGNDEVGVDIVAGGVGAITDNDVTMAENTGGYIIGFNMRPVTSARKLAELKGIDVKTYSIIYELIDAVTAALEGMLEPESIEKYIGRAEVRDTFSIPKIGTIAGCGVIDGKIERGCNIRLLREGKILFDGKLSTLKRFKDEVKEVTNGYECGMALEGYNDIKNSDLIEAYTLEQKERKLEVSSIY